MKRLDANGNTTCYAYDALHRVAHISYPSGDPNPTPDKYFAYDGANLDSTNMANVAGKLAEAYTGTPAAKITDLGFSFPNPGGDQEEVYQSSPNSGGWHVSSAQHYPNGVASNLVVPGLTAAVTYGLDGEGRPNLVDGATTLAGAAVYSALGLTSVTFGSGDSDTYQYDAATGRMNQYQFQVNGATDTGALTWNANGSLGRLAITDSIAGSRGGVHGRGQLEPDVQLRFAGQCVEERDAIVPAQLWDQQPHRDQHQLRAQLRQRRQSAGRPGERAAKRERL